MQTVVFLLYHGMGHFNACFRLAKILRPNYDVVFAGFSSFEKYVESQGFMYYALKTLPFGYGFEQWVNQQENRKPVYVRCILDRWSDRLYKLREIELHQLMRDLTPEYLFIDAYQATDLIVLYSHVKKYLIKVCFIQTMLPTAMNKNCPPLNSDAMPGDTHAIRRANQHFNFTLFKKRLKNKFLFLGMGDADIIKRRIKKNKIPKHYLSSEKTWRGLLFSQVDEWVLAPKEFDFDCNSRLDSHYLGFTTDLQRMEISDTEYFKTDQFVRNKLKETNGTLLYCSFGSVVPTETQQIYNFIKKLIQSVRDQNCILLISNSTIHQQYVFTNLPENVFIFKAAPQLEILERADVFIHHGGLNSIKESIYAGVPMLVYPFDVNTDRIGNASRVVYHGLGLRGDLLEDTTDGITQKLLELVNNERYKNNIHAMRQHDEQYEEEFLKRFINLKPVN